MILRRTLRLGSEPVRGFVPLRSAGGRADGGFEADALATLLRSQRPSEVMAFARRTQLSFLIFASLFIPSLSLQPAANIVLQECTSSCFVFLFGGGTRRVQIAIFSMVFRHRCNLQVFFWRLYCISGLQRRSKKSGDQGTLSNYTNVSNNPETVFANCAKVSGVMFLFFGGFVNVFFPACGFGQG